MYPVQVNNDHTGDGVLLYGLQGTSFYKQTEVKSVEISKDPRTQGQLATIRLLSELNAMSNEEKKEVFKRHPELFINKTI